MMEQFTPTGMTEQPVNPTPQETQAEFSTPSEHNSHDLPGLRPLNSDLIKHEHHEKKPELSVKPPAVEMETQSPTPLQVDISPPQVFSAQPAVPAVPPPAPAVPPPAPAVPFPAPDVPPPAPAVPPASPSSVQMDYSNQMFPSMEPNIPMVPMPPPQFFAPNFIPLASVPLPMFLPGKYDYLEIIVLGNVTLFVYQSLLWLVDSLFQPRMCISFLKVWIK